MSETALPRLLLTLGDVAGIGPEIIVRGWPEVLSWCQPVVVGDPVWLQRAAALVGSPAQVQVVSHPAAAQPSPTCLPCLPGSRLTLEQVTPGQVSAAAGRAAYDFLCTAIDWVRAGAAAGLVTAPVHKAGLQAAGLAYPGHTEILAERTGSRSYAMLLYAQNQELPHGLAVVHVTLHCALREVFARLSVPAIVEKIRLLDEWLQRFLGRAPRLGLAALNPHASDGGRFGDEEEQLLLPAVRAGQELGIAISGPWPSDTLFGRARRGEFDGVVALYHDQGHIPLKLLGGLYAVNVTLGLPLIRTSVAHGTAYDIAWQGRADPRSLVEAVRIAARLARPAPTAPSEPRPPETGKVRR